MKTYKHNLAAINGSKGQDISTDLALTDFVSHSAIVGWDFYVQDVRYLAVPWMAKSHFGSVSFSPKEMNSTQSKLPGICNILNLN